MLDDNQVHRVEPFVEYKKFALDSQLTYFRRIASSGQPQCHFDVIGDYWVFVIVDNHKSWGSIWRGGKHYSLKCRVGSFLPPFSLVQWHILPGPHIYHTFVSTAFLDNDLPKEPVSFMVEDTFLPETTSEIFDVIKRCKNSPSLTPIFRIGNTSAIARKTKIAIDDTYKWSVSIEEIANVLKVSRVVASRSFTATFGLSPADYRKKIRLLDGFRYIFHENRSISEAAHLSGFNNLSLFNRQFRHEFACSPSDLRKKSV